MSADSALQDQARAAKQRYEEQRHRQKYRGATAWRSSRDRGGHTAAHQNTARPNLTRGSLRTSSTPGGESVGTHTQIRGRSVA